MTEKKSIDEIIYQLAADVNSTDSPVPWVAYLCIIREQDACAIIYELMASHVEKHYPTVHMQSVMEGYCTLRENEDNGLNHLVKLRFDAAYRYYKNQKRVDPLLGFNSQIVVREINTSIRQFVSLVMKGHDPFSGVASIVEGQGLFELAKQYHDLFSDKFKDLGISMSLFSQVKRLLDEGDQDVDNQLSPFKYKSRRTHLCPLNHVLLHLEMHPECMEALDLTRNYQADVDTFEQWLHEQQDSLRFPTVKSVSTFQPPSSSATSSLSSSLS